MGQIRRYLIDLPVARYSAELRLVGVSTASPKSLRQHVERFACYFLREMHTGGLQFEAAETPESPGFVEYKAFLFAAQDRYVGAACFRHRSDQNVEVPWLFDWLWLHPYFRHKGLLSVAWPTFERNVGKFRLAHPISLHMQLFLRKVGWHEAPYSSPPDSQTASR